MIDHWWEWLLLLVIGIGEFYLSWLNHRINYLTFRKKKWRATRYDFIANLLSELIPLFIYVYAQKWIYVVPRIIANTMGTFKAASRKKQGTKKQKKQKKVVFTTA